MNFEIFEQLVGHAWYTYFLLPLLIFCFRIIDQSIGTVRLIFSAKGLKNLAPLFAFFESFIWLLAIGQIMKDVSNILMYVAFAGGYATGNYFGILLEEKLSVGNVIIRVVPKHDTGPLISYLRNLGYGVTVVPVEGSLGPTKMLFLTIRRKEAKKVISIINEFNPNAFYTMDEVKTVRGGYYASSPKSIFSMLNPFQKTVKT